MMVGRRSFPFEMVPFEGTYSNNGSLDLPHLTVSHASTASRREAFFRGAWTQDLPATGEAAITWNDLPQIWLEVIVSS